MYAFTRDTDPGIVAISNMFKFLVANDSAGHYHDPTLYYKDPITTILPEKFSKGLSFTCLNYDLNNINYLHASERAFGVNQCTNAI